LISSNGEGSPARGLDNNFVTDPRRPLQPVCPICGATVRLEFSQPTGDATCPACGALLWYVAVDSGVKLFDPANLRELLAQSLGVNDDAIEFHEGTIKIEGLDSLDMAELLLELEEDFGDGEEGTRRPL
jgi:hypothetical protein